MKLNAGIIYDNLKTYVPTEMYGPRSDELLLDRPTFFLGNEKVISAGQLYISLADRLPLRPEIQKDVVLICVGNSQRLAYYQERCCVLHVKEKADFFQVANLVHQIFERYTQWNEKLLEILTNTASVQDLIEKSSTIFGNPLFVINADFHVIASVGYDESYLPYAADSTDDPDNVSLPKMAQFLELHELSMHKQEPLLLNLLDSSTLNTNMHRNGEYLGCLTIDYQKRRHNPSDISLAKHLAHMITLALEKLSSETSNERNVLKQALRDLVEGLPISPDQQQVLEAQLKRRFVCAKMKLESRFAKLPTGYMCNELENIFPGSMAFVHESSIVGFIEIAIFPESAQNDEEALKERLTEFISSMDMHVATSNVFKGLLSARLFYRQASNVLEIGELVYPHDRYYTFEEYVLTDLVMNAIGDLPYEMYFSEGLHNLAAHDAKAEISYTDTLRVFLENNMSIAKTSAALYIHRSTLLERIARIKRELGTDLEDPDERLRIQILLKAVQIHSEMRGHSSESE